MHPLEASIRQSSIEEEPPDIERGATLQSNKVPPRFLEDEEVLVGSLNVVIG